MPKLLCDILSHLNLEKKEKKKRRKKEKKKKERKKEKEKKREYITRKSSMLFSSMF